MLLSYSKNIKGELLYLKILLNQNTLYLLLHGYIQF